MVELRLKVNVISKSIPGMQLEVHSFLLKRRERTLAARSAVLEMLEVKEDRRFGSLDDDSAKVKWMWRVHLRVDYT